MFKHTIVFQCIITPHHLWKMFAFLVSQPLIKITWASISEHLSLSGLSLTPQVIGGGSEIPFLPPAKKMNCKRAVGVDSGKFKVFDQTYEAALCWIQLLADLAYSFPWLTLQGLDRKGFSSHTAPWKSFNRDGRDLRLGPSLGKTNPLSIKAIVPAGVRKTRNYFQGAYLKGKS